MDEERRSHERASRKEDDPEAARQTLMNLALMDRLEQAGAKVYREFLSTVSLWQALQDWLATPEVAAGARQALWGAA